MSATARALVEQTTGDGPLPLGARAERETAQAFYEARGGKPVGREIGGPFPGGGTAPSLRYAWPDPKILIVPA